MNNLRGRFRFTGPSRTGRASRAGFGALLASLLALPMVLAVAAPAGATTTSTGSFVYSGSNTDTKTLIDTHLFYIDGCIIGDDPVTCFPDDFPGTLWGRVRAGVKFTTVTSQSADFSMSAPDTFRQDTNAPFTQTLTTKDASGQEVKVKATPFLNVDVAYDAPIANCSKNTITNDTELANADTSGCLNAVVHTGDVDLANLDIFAKDLQLPYSGTASATDTHEGPSLDIGQLFLGIPDLIKVRLDLDVTTALTATLGYHADRVIAASSDPGNPLASGQISFPSANPVDDTVHIPCSAPVGDNLVYKLNNNQWTGTGKVDVSPKIVIVTPLPDIDIPLGFSVNLFDGAVTSQAAPDFSAVLGEILPDNKPPVISAVDAPDGAEGTPVQFGATATDNCGTPTLRWDFSDGGVAFGPNPQHTFTDNGVYSGQVTATDAAGNTATKNFTVTIANVKPNVNAGPDTTSDWGRLVSFNGQATDPGSADQSTLQYTWSFGDGTPSASGGPSVVHSYASPGANGYYDATLTVCDKDGACNSSTRRVYVTKRDTTTSYLGDTSGTYDTSASVGASLVDEYGQAVNGRSITFQVGTDGPLTGLTNSSGIATKSYTPTLAAGSYTGSSSFAGDALYNASNSSNGFAETQKGTGIAYTGAVTGGPNKSVVLSAVLTDATGKKLAGKLVDFQLGSQTVLSVVTDANGVASTSLKLNQKNGTYTVSATYTPVGADTGRYLGSSQGVIFKLQAK